MEVFVGDFTDIIIEGFKPGSPYNDVSTSPAKLPLGYVHVLLFFSNKLVV